MGFLQLDLVRLQTRPAEKGPTTRWFGVARAFWSAGIGMGSEEVRKHAGMWRSTRRCGRDLVVGWW